MNVDTLSELFKSIFSAQKKPALSKCESSVPNMDVRVQTFFIEGHMHNIGGAGPLIRN